MSEPQPDKPTKKVFRPESLNQTVIAIPLLEKLKEDKQKTGRLGIAEATPTLFGVIIDLNLEFRGGRAGAKKWVVKTLNRLITKLTQDPNHQAAGLYADKQPKNQFGQQYLFVQLEAPVIEALVQRDRRDHDAPPKTDPSLAGPKAIYRIWPDFAIKGLLNKSISTVKGDAAHASYSAVGHGIVWAVMDSGIDQTHKHFTTHENLKLKLPLKHTDFTGSADPDAALTDKVGHGTHVAGIIAGIWPTDGPALKAFNRQRDENGEVTYAKVAVKSISGIAPRCQLLSLKVMDDDGQGGTQGEASNLMAAIALVQELNGHGRKLIVHDVNMSVGYEFDPEWFACGQSPLCVEINRLVRSGVVVMAAGNTGYGAQQSQFNGVVRAGMGLTINDPGNADLAITVGSTHRDMPHIYGVSYFSSKGPTGDGRATPDLVAPGEKILSCATGELLQNLPPEERSSNYVEDSGTSMAAPHVSGAITAFLSIRREFVGEPEKVKDVFMGTATDLKRERYFQGAGLVDLMRAIQSV